MSKKGVDHQGGDQGICPTCGCTDPAMCNYVAPDKIPTYLSVSHEWGSQPTDCCPDPWHNPDSPPPETPGQREQWSEGWPKKVAIYSGDWAKGHRDRWVVPLSEANRLIAEREQQYKNLLVAGEDQTTAFEAALSDTNHLRERAERAEADRTCEGCGQGLDVTIHACSNRACEHGPRDGEPRFGDGEGEDDDSA